VGPLLRALAIPVVLVQFEEDLVIGAAAASICDRCASEPHVVRVAGPAFRARDAPAECAAAIGERMPRSARQGARPDLPRLAQPAPPRAPRADRRAASSRCCSARARARTRTPTRRCLPASSPTTTCARDAAEGEAGWQRVVMRRGLQRKPVLAADTTVALAGEILGKPADRDDAERMLRCSRARSTACSPRWRCSSSSASRWR
jgi:hypothetical protein